MKKRNLYTILLALLSLQLSQSQCFEDRHSTNWYDGWVSCEISQNPIASYGKTHWILYDFGYDYTLSKSQIWNANEPKNLDYGIQKYTVDYSTDAINWINLGEFVMERASGASTYQGNKGPDFKAIKARYVLITPSSNYGGSCYGLSELKISITNPLLDVNEEEGFKTTIYPNPFIDNISIKIATLDINTPIEYRLYDILGRTVTQNSLIITEGNSAHELSINGSNLSVGLYVLKITQNGKEQTYKLVKNE